MWVYNYNQGECSFTQCGVGLPPCLKRQQIFKFWHVRSLVSTIFDPNVVANELACKGSSSDMIHMILIFVILCLVSSFVQRRGKDWFQCAFFFLLSLGWSSTKHTFFCALKQKSFEPSVFSMVCMEIFTLISPAFSRSLMASL